MNTLTNTLKYNLALNALVQVRVSAKNAVSASYGPTSSVPLLTGALVRTVPSIMATPTAGPVTET